MKLPVGGEHMLNPHDPARYVTNGGVCCSGTRMSIDQEDILQHLRAHAADRDQHLRMHALLHSPRSAVAVLTQQLTPPKMCLLATQQSLPPQVNVCRCT